MGLKSCFLCAAIFLCSSFSFSQVRKYSNEFLNIGVGARALGMSNAVATFNDDASAGYWNPANLMSLNKKYNVGLMHTEYFAGIVKYDYAGFAMKVDDKSALGATIIRLGVDDIPNTTRLITDGGNIDYDRITSFSVADWAVLLSYARKSKISGLNYGVNTKVIYRYIGDFATSWGIGFDFGLTYTKGDWLVALSNKDITTTFNAWNFTLSDETKEIFIQTENALPKNGIEITAPKSVLGIARRFLIKEKIGVLAEADFDFTFDGYRNVLIKSNSVSIDPHVGVEVDYKKMIFLRAGVGGFQEQTDLLYATTTAFQINFGVGFTYKNISLGYALTDLGDNTAALYSNVFSLRIRAESFKN